VLDGRSGVRCCDMQCNNRLIKRQAPRSMGRRRRSVNAAGDLDLRPACPAFLAAFALGALLSAVAAARPSSRASAVAAAAVAPGAAARRPLKRPQVWARPLARRRSARPVWRRLANGLALAAPGSRLRPPAPPSAWLVGRALRRGERLGRRRAGLAARHGLALRSQVELLPR
jgi:hypothetical protein